MKKIIFLILLLGCVSYKSASLILEDYHKNIGVNDFIYLKFKNLSTIPKFELYVDGKKQNIEVDLLGDYIKNDVAIKPVDKKGYYLSFLPNKDYNLLIFTSVGNYSLTIHTGEKDTTKPILKRVEIVGNNLKLLFNERINYYKINNSYIEGLNFNSSVVMTSQNPIYNDKMIYLELVNFSYDQNYTFTIRYFEDVSGNIMEPQTFKYINGVLKHCE